MKKKLFYIPLFAAFLVVFTGCDSDEALQPEGDTTAQETPLQLTQSELAAAQNIASFNGNFLKSVNAIQSDRDENIAVSPVSAQILLSMVANACSDAAAREIAGALGCNDIEALNSLSVKYQETFPSVDRNTEIALANSVWYDSDYELAREFGSILNSKFHTDALQRNFSDSEPLTTEINRWCADNTNNLITRIIDNINPDAAAMLLNAIYFKGNWTEPFDAAATTSSRFNGVKSQADVKMMNRTIVACYKNGSNFQAVNIPFGNKSFSAWFVMPEEGVDINSFLDGFNSAELSGISTWARVDLAMPKFKYATPEIKLDDALRAIGVNAIFNGTDLDMFAPALKGKLIVSQKSTVEFSEKGAEASSVTVGEVLDTSWNQHVTAHVKMTIDRPFLFFITERQTGACLMAGKIANL